MYKRTLTAAPYSPVKEGEVQFGCYKTPFKEVDLMKVKRPYALPLLPQAKYMQLREWQAFQMGNSDYFMMVALYNAKKLALVQFIFYEIKTQRKFKFEKKVPLWKIKVPNSLWDTIGSYESKDTKIKVHHSLANQKLELRVDIKGTKKMPSIKGHFFGEHDTKKYEPMVVSMPFNKRRGMYSHKCLMPMEGELELNDEKITFKKTESHLILDDHKGYYPFPTRYDWITGMGFKNGKRIGFNLTDNQVIEQEKYNENCLWLDGKIHPLPPIKVSRPNGYKDTWIIKDKYGAVDLEFTPVVHTAVNVNLILFQSKYQGPYGYFKGHLNTEDGGAVEINSVFGMGEDFYLRI